MKPDQLEAYINRLKAANADRFSASKSAPELTDRELDAWVVNRGEIQVEWCWWALEEMQAAWAAFPKSGWPTSTEGRLLQSLIASHLTSLTRERVLDTFTHWQELLKEQRDGK